MTKAEITELRVTALQLACGHGLPPELVLKTAHGYLSFLEGTEEVSSAAGEWVVKNLHRAIVATHKPTAKAAPAKKASPRKR